MKLCYSISTHVRKVQITDTSIGQRVNAFHIISDPLAVTHFLFTDQGFYNDLTCNRRAVFCALLFAATFKHCKWDKLTCLMHEQFSGSFVFIKRDSSDCQKLITF